jgi:hypothetical protein
VCSAVLAAASSAAQCFPAVLAAAASIDLRGAALRCPSQPRQARGATERAPQVSAAAAAAASIHVPRSALRCPSQPCQARGAIERAPQVSAAAAAASIHLSFSSICDAPHSRVKRVRRPKVSPMVASRALGTLMCSLRYLLAAWSALQQQRQDINTVQVHSHIWGVHAAVRCTAGSLSCSLRYLLAAWSALQQQDQRSSSAGSADAT